MKLSLSAIESRTRRPLRPCKGRSDARRESADAEGTRSSEIEARPWRERAADRGDDRGQPVDGRRISAPRLTWPVPEGVDDAELERRLFTLPTFDEKPARPLPAWSHVHKELKRRAVTLHRTVRTKGALSAKTAKLMVFKLINAAAKTWRRLNGENQLPKVVQGVKFKNGIEVIEMPAHHAA